MTKFKYNEDKILAEINEYIEKTYDQHYASGAGDSNEKLQTFDVWEALEIADVSCQSNVLKYAMRYGKKDGYNKKDLLKIIHYTILWWYYTQDQENPAVDKKETANNVFVQNPGDSITYDPKIL